MGTGAGTRHIAGRPVALPRPPDLSPPPVNGGGFFFYTSNKNTFIVKQSVCNVKKTGGYENIKMMKNVSQCHKLLSIF
jgi:hypothetical protein